MDETAAPEATGTAPAPVAWQPVVPPTAILFDAGCTLVQPNVDRLHAALPPDVASGVDGSRLDAALWRSLARIDAHYGPDAGGYDRWFPRWLDELADAVGVPRGVFGAAWHAADGEAHLWDQPIPGVRPALERLLAADVRIAVVSNSDGRVTGALERAGLAELFEVIVDSGVVGVAKPDPAVLIHALEPMGLSGEGPRPDLWYVGDTVSYDAAAADAAGLMSWIVDHRGLHTTPHPRRVRSLDELADRALDHPERAGAATTGEST